MCIFGEIPTKADSSGLQMDVNSHFQADATGDNEVFDSFIVSEKGLTSPRP